MSLVKKFIIKGFFPFLIFLGYGEKMKNDRDLIEQYEAYLRVEKNYSDHTVLNYIRDIEDFSAFLSEQGFGSLSSIQKGNIPRYYLSNLTNRGYSRSSISRKLSSIRSFYLHLYRKGLIKEKCFCRN